MIIQTYKLTSKHLTLLLDVPKLQCATWSRGKHIFQWYVNKKVCEGEEDQYTQLLHHLQICQELLLPSLNYLPMFTYPKLT